MEGILPAIFRNKRNDPANIPIVEISMQLSEDNLSTTVTRIAQGLNQISLHRHIGKEFPKRLQTTTTLFLFAAMAISIVLSACETVIAKTPLVAIAPAQTAHPAEVGIRIADSERHVKPSTNPAAQARFEAGQKSLLALKYNAAVDDFRAAIELAPDFLGAHQNYITASIYFKLSQTDQKVLLPRHYDKGLALTRKSMAMPSGGGPATDELLPIYEAWAEKWKSNPAVQWGLGKVLLDRDNARAVQVFNQVLELDPNFAAAWRSLAALDWQIKNQKSYKDKLEKAIASDPNNPDLAYEYNTTRKTTEPSSYQQGLMDIVARFPRTSTAASAMNMQLGETKIPDEKKAILQQMRQDYPDEDYSLHYFNMLQLYGLIAPQEPEQALVLLKELQKNFTDDKDLGELVSYQQQMIGSRELVREKKFSEAAKALGALTLPRRADAAAYYLLLAEAVGAGDLEKAYQSLLTPTATPDHNQALETALQQLGTSLSKTPAMIEDDLWEARVAQSQPFMEFELVEYKSGKPVKLSDYRGKVVLVNFWFPACGPCMNEFPLVQEALKKYGPQGFVVLAINIIPDEDDQVLPLLKTKGFDFIALKVPNKNWARDQYKVNAAPLNFLLDEQGRMIFKPKISDKSTQSRFFGEIETLVKRIPVISANKDTSR